MKDGGWGGLMKKRERGGESATMKPRGGDRGGKDISRRREFGGRRGVNV